MTDEPSFWRFLHLPPELRGIIWSLTLLDPIIIRAFMPSSHVRHVLYLTGLPPPPLFVCRESRALALKVFTRLEQEFQGSILVTKSVYFRPSTDILFLDIKSDEFDMVVTTHKELKDITQIETIAVSLHGLCEDYHFFKGEANPYVAVRRLLLVANEVDHGPSSCCSYFRLSEVPVDWVEHTFACAACQFDRMALIEKHKIRPKVVKAECVCHVYGQQT